MTFNENKASANMHYCILFIIHILLASTIQAQVTIGSALKPNRGALLELKEWEQTNGGANSTKGVILPRVKLTKLDELIDIPEATNTDYTGLMVYNINDDVCNAPAAGTYVWNGTTWMGIGIQNRSPEVYDVVDPRDGEIYLARNFGDIAGDWMLENMRYIPKDEDGYIDYEHRATDSPAPHTAKYYAYPEGIERPYIPSNHPSPKWEANKKNGLLYNWIAATNGENTSIAEQGQTPTGGDPITTPIRGICPLGWHLPSDKEYNDLEKEIYKNAHLYSTYSESDKISWGEWQPTWDYTINIRPSGTVSGAHGTAMKTPCPPGSSNSLADGKSHTSTQGGFNVVLAGYGSSGSISAYGNRSSLWTSSSHNASNARDRNVRVNFHGVYINISGRTYLYAVRCKR